MSPVQSVTYVPGLYQRCSRLRPVTDYYYLTFLAWAEEPSVCIVCNLHVRHTEDGKRNAAADFRRIIDRVIEHRGRYYLTYHRWAERKQVETCYPQFVDFLRLKRKYDPEERFQSDWYRHYKAMFADKL